MPFTLRNLKADLEDVGSNFDGAPAARGVALPAGCGILPRTMSEESTTPDLAELTRLAFEAVNQRDIDAVMSFFAPDAVLDGRAAGGLYEGRVGNSWLLGRLVRLLRRASHGSRRVRRPRRRGRACGGQPRGSSGRRRWSSPSAGGMGHLLVGRWPPRAIDDPHRSSTRLVLPPNGSPSRGARRSKRRSRCRWSRPSTLLWRLAREGNAAASLSTQATQPGVP